MLTGVSHDLRTILTRFRLQLALLGDTPDVEALRPRRRRHAAHARGLSRLRPRRGRRGCRAEPISTVFSTRSPTRRSSGQRTLTTALTGDPMVNVRPQRLHAAASPTSSRNACRHGDTSRSTATHARRLADDHRRRRRTGHPGDEREDGVQALLPPRRGAQSRRERHRPRPVDRPRHRPRPWRRHHPREARSAASAPRSRSRPEPGLLGPRHDRGERHVERPLDAAGMEFVARLGVE